MAVVLALIGVFPVWRGESVRIWALAAAAALALLALALPRVLAPFNRVWTALGLLLGKVVNPIVLSALYLLVFTPAAVLMRASGKDPLRLKRSGGVESYWIPREGPRFEPASMRRQF